jgi:hypothetical protein
MLSPSKSDIGDRFCYISLNVIAKAANLSHYCSRPSFEDMLAQEESRLSSDKLNDVAPLINNAPYLLRDASSCDLAYLAYCRHR